MKYPVSFLFIVFMAACNPGNISSTEIKLKDLGGKDIEYNTLGGNNPTVFIFMNPECPLCISYSGIITEIDSFCSSKGINLFSVYPGTYYSVEEITRFKNSYMPGARVLLDQELQLTKLLKAAVTPEAVVVDKDNTVLYSGAIDDRAFAPGKKRQHASKHYLYKVLDDIVNGKQITYKRTTPVGCVIE